MKLKYFFLIIKINYKVIFCLGSGEGVGVWFGDEEGELEVKLFEKMVRIYNYYNKWIKKKLII